MPRGSNGNASLDPIYKAVPDTDIVSPQHNTPLEDIVSMLTGSLARNGTGGMQADLNMGNNEVTNAAEATSTDSLVTLGQVQDLLSGAGFGVPTGVGMWNTGTVVPAGWLRANGQAVSRSTYAALWAWAQDSGNLAVNQGSKTSAQYGPGDGATTFTLPNLEGSGMFLRSIGPDNSFGAVQNDSFASHTHTGSADSAGAHTHTVSGTAASDGAHSHTASTNSTGAHTHTVSGTAASAGAHAHTVNLDNATNPTGGTANLAGTNNSNVDGTVATNSAGAHTHTVSGTAASAGAHVHTVTVNSGGAHTHAVSGSAASGGAHTHSLTIAAAGGTETRPKNVSYMFIIKT